MVFTGLPGSRPEEPHAGTIAPGLDGVTGMAGNTDATCH